MGVLLTGSTGFVGQSLISYFSKFEVGYLSLSRQELTIGTYNKINKTDVVIHLAGKAHDLKNTSDPEGYYRINFELTKRLYDTFLRSDADKFIFISSVKAVADHIDTPLTEDYKPDPKTHYGKSKLRAEEYIKSQPLPEGKSYYILRPCMIHGPGNKGNLNLLYQFVRKGIPYPLAAFENKRSFLSIDNLCFVLKRLIEDTTIPSGVYHLADDEALSTNEVVKTISETLHRKPRLLAIPQSILKTIAKIGDAIRMPLNSERLKKLTENYIVSNDKIKKTLQMDSFPVSSREGLRKTIKSFDSINS